MNDNDIQLIASLIGGELSKADESIAFDRINSDPALQAAYDEQIAVASILQSAPKAAMTATESAALNATLRTELGLEDAAVVAAAPSRWSRWWAPLSGLAAAAVVVFAVAIAPNLLDNTDSADVVSAPAETTVAPSEMDTLGDGEANLLREADAPGEDAPSSTAATSESAGTEESVEELASSYFLSPQAATQSQLDLPVVDDAAVDSTGLDAAVAKAGELASVNVSALSACFGAGTAGSALAPVGVTPDGSSVYAVATDLETGNETPVRIDLSTCAVASAD